MLLAVSVTEHHTKNDFETPFPRTPIGMVNVALNRPNPKIVTLKKISTAGSPMKIRLRRFALQSLCSRILGISLSKWISLFKMAMCSVHNYMGVFGNKMASFAERNSTT
ncbi:hypothetical protein OK016_15235 [Vibrio chagasii]|nr:hypothetical protein [Vibrio chagasii]